MKRWTGIACLVLVAAFLIGGCAQSQVPVPRTSQVTGRVFDVTTYRVPQGVRVLLDGQPVDVREGAFFVSRLSIGSHTISALAPGYVAYLHTIQVGETALNVELPLEPAETEPAPVPAPAPTPSARFSASDVDLLARLVHAEAEGEPYPGQVAVAATILHRVDDPNYPDTIPGVIYQVWDGKYVQYEPVLNGRINLPADDSAKRAVQDALAGVDPSRGATGFYNPAKTSNQWVRDHEITTIIGNHYFFK